MRTPLPCTHFSGQEAEVQRGLVTNTPQGPQARLPDFPAPSSTRGRLETITDTLSTQV